MPQPFPYPWPAPTPGVGSPTPSPGIGTPPAIGFPIPTPGLPSASFWQPFADLFGFAINWGFWGALMLMTVSVALVDQYAPEYTWVYIVILLLGLILERSRFSNFGENLKGLVG
jgi:hypothetical protein